MLGVDTKHKLNLKCSAVINDAWIYLNNSANPFYYPTEHLCWYGEKSSEMVLGNCVPIYKAQCDYGNLRLYEMMKIVGVENVVYRKRDAFVCRPNHKVPTKYLGSQDGYLKGEQLPTTIKSTTHKHLPEPPLLITDRYEPNRSYTSDDAGAVVKLLDERKGVELTARAGYGKSHIARAITDLLRKRGLDVAVVSPSNKAANNHKDGRTLHKLFCMSPNDQMAEPSAIRRVVRNHQAIVVDEISMVGSQMWLALANVRAQAPEMLILLVGDWRQLGAIEGAAIYKSGFCGHPILDYLTNSTRIGLEYSKSCRNDPILQDISDRVDDVRAVKAATSMDKSLKTLNIAFTNKKVAEINQLVLATELPKTPAAEGFVLPNAPADWANADQPSAKKAWANAAWTLASGQPMMLEKFNKKYSEHPKNTTLTIEAADANNITIAAVNGINSFKIPTKDFWELLRPAYCLTTHKSQCETYHQPYNIYEYWRMDTRMRYTALTRAKTAGQITIM
jgi:hypothetical protein